MNLEDQIAQITNPQEFARLCDAILTAKYANDFQGIDGTRSDEGNDGYVYSEKRVIAMYCPIKPERKTDKDYIAKIRSDLAKADNLRKSGKYEVENWTFITPRKLSNNVVSVMQHEAGKLGLNANHLESAFLTNELYNNRHIIKAFPQLQVSDIESKLDEIIGLLKERPPEESKRPINLDKDHIYKPDTKDNKDFDRVIALRKGTRTDKTKSELRSIYYKVTDPSIHLNALLGLLEFWDPMEDSVEDMVQLCNSGIQKASQTKEDSVRAYLLAQKGYYLSYIYSHLDMNTAFQIMADNAVGIPTITEIQRQTILKKLERLEKQYTQAFDEALEISKANYDIRMLADVLIFIGNAAGQRSMYLQPLGVVDRAQTEKQTCKHALLTARDAYEYLGDELGTTNALFNLANQIGFSGEKEEALELTKNAMDVAKKYGDARLMQKVTWLKETLETGKIPDYLHGERRV